jgi:hypothetical protein
VTERGGGEVRGKLVECCCITRLYSSLKYVVHAFNPSTCVVCYASVLCGVVCVVCVMCVVCCVCCVCCVM